MQTSHRSTDTVLDKSAAEGSFHAEHSVSRTMHSCTAASLSVYVKVMVITAFCPDDFHTKREWTNLEGKTWLCSSPLPFAVLNFRAFLLIWSCWNNTCAAPRLVRCDPGQLAWKCSLACWSKKKKKKKCYNRLKSPLTVSFCSCLLLWFHLSPLCLFSCVRLPLLSGCTDHFHYRKCPSGRICMPSWALFSCL